MTHLTRLHLRTLIFADLSVWCFSRIDAVTNINGQNDAKIVLKMEKTGASQSVTGSICLAGIYLEQLKNLQRSLNLLESNTVTYLSDTYLQL